MNTYASKFTIKTVKMKITVWEIFFNIIKEGLEKNKQQKQ